MGRSNVDRDVSVITSLLADGAFDALEAPALRLLRKNRKHPVGIKALSMCLMARGEGKKALGVLEGGLKSYPGDWEMHNNLGICLSGLGRYGEALRTFQIALHIAPHAADVLANLAIASLNLGSFDEAIAFAQRAIAIAPKHKEAFNTLGAALLKQGSLPEALRAFQNAVVNHPDSLVAFQNFVVTLIDSKRFGDAIRCIQPMLAGVADDTPEAEALAPLLYFSQRSLCEWKGHPHISSDIRKLVERQVKPGPEPFFLTHVEGIDRTIQRRCAETYGRDYLAAIFGDDLPEPLWSAGETRATSSRPLRIGFLSADFRNHAVGELAVAVFEGLDRSRFSLFAYAYGRADAGPLRQRLEKSFDIFRDINSLSFLDAARMINDDGIDILIDMAGWTWNTRLAVLAYRPAPVMAHWLGFPATLGLQGIVDYLISDRHITPLEHGADYAERLALLPHSYQPNSRVLLERPRPTRGDVGLPEDAFVFCSFNQSIKITPQVFGLWCEILKRNPNSVLWIGFQNEEAQANLLAEAAAREVPANRFVFAPWCASIAAHWDRLGLADLALDTYPFGGHATASDLLWAGVPLVAWAGDTFASRVAASLLNALGLPELVACSEREYVDLVDGLARSPQRLSELKARLLAAKATAPLFDTQRFGRDFGRLLDAMWSRHLSGTSGSIALSPD